MSILQRLREDRVVTFHVLPDRQTVEVRERCDEWFYVSLDKDELSTLIDELQTLHGEMK